MQLVRGRDFNHKLRHVIPCHFNSLPNGRALGGDVFHDKYSLGSNSLCVPMGYDMVEHSRVRLDIPPSRALKIHFKRKLFVVPSRSIRPRPPMLQLGATVDPYHSCSSLG